jgi:hypothetical protein
MILHVLMNLGFAGGGGAIGPPATLDDLTWLFAQYLPSLASAHPGTDDACTQLAADLSTVRTNSTKFGDLNTMYAIYLSPRF